MSHEQTDAVQKMVNAFFLEKKILRTGAKLPCSSQSFLWLGRRSFTPSGRYSRSMAVLHAQKLCGGGQHKEGGGVRPWSKMCAAAARRAGQSQGAPGRRRPPPAHLDLHDWARRAGGGCVECLPGVALTLCRPCADSMRVFWFSQLEYTTPRQNGKFAGQGYFLPVSQLCSVLTRASAAGFRVYALI